MIAGSKNEVWSAKTLRSELDKLLCTFLSGFRKIRIIWIFGLFRVVHDQDSFGRQDDSFLQICRSGYFSKQVVAYVPVPCSRMSVETAWYSAGSRHSVIA
jgi:hypothetical protein